MTQIILYTLLSIYLILFVARLFTGPMPRIIELSNGKYDIEVRALFIPFLKHRFWDVSNKKIFSIIVTSQPVYSELSSLIDLINDSNVKKLGYYTPTPEPEKDDLLIALKEAKEKQDHEEIRVLESIIKRRQ